MKIECMNVKDPWKMFNLNENWVDKLYALLQLKVPAGTV